MFLRTTSTLLTLAFMIVNIRAEGNSACDSSGIELSATPEVNILTSPGYPDDYHNNQLCRWTIAAEHSYQVVRFEILDMRVRNTAACLRDFLQIQDGTQAGAVTMKKCCKKICKKGEIVTTSEQDALITFRSDTSKNDNGFQIKYWAVTKTGREIAEVKLSGANYALMGLFIVIATAAIVTLVVIHILHTCPQFCNKVRHHVKCISPHKKPHHMNHITNGSTVNPEYACGGGGAGDKSFATSSTNVSAWSSPNGTVHNSHAEIV